jgi:cytochrome c551/c552
MRSSVLACAVALLTTVFASSSRATVSPEQPARPVSSVESQAAFVQTYCAGCHNDRVRSGGFSWASIDLAHPDQHREQIEEVLRKVRAGLMPPAGARRR